METDMKGKLNKKDETHFIYCADPENDACKLNLLLHPFPLWLKLTLLSAEGWKGTRRAKGGQKNALSALKMGEVKKKKKNSNQ